MAPDRQHPWPLGRAQCLWRPCESQNPGDTEALCSLQVNRQSKSRRTVAPQEGENLMHDSQTSTGHLPCQSLLSQMMKFEMLSKSDRAGLPHMEYHCDVSSSRFTSGKFLHRHEALRSMRVQTAWQHPAAFPFRNHFSEPDCQSHAGSASQP